MLSPGRRAAVVGRPNGQILSWWSGYLRWLGLGIPAKVVTALTGNGGYGIQAGPDLRFVGVPSEGGNKRACGDLDGREDSSAFEACVVAGLRVHPWGGAWPTFRLCKPSKRQRFVPPKSSGSAANCCGGSSKTRPNAEPHPWPRPNDPPRSGCPRHDPS